MQLWSLRAVNKASLKWWRTYTQPPIPLIDSTHPVGWAQWKNLEMKLLLIKFYFLYVLPIRSPLPSGTSLLPSWGPSRGNLFRERCHSTWSQWWLLSVITIPHICLFLYNGNLRPRILRLKVHKFATKVLNEGHPIILGLSDPFVTLELLPRRIFNSCEPM